MWLQSDERSWDNTKRSGVGEFPDDLNKSTGLSGKKILRTLIGLACLIIGVLTLGMWARAVHAPEIQTRIFSAASSSIGTTTHPIEVFVLGRDIRITGLADSAEERDKIVAALDATKGRRVVVDDLDILQPAAPFVFNAGKTDNDTIYSGNVATEKLRGKIAGGIGQDNAEKLVLASGMPNDTWPDFAISGVAALKELKNGTMEINDTRMTLQGLAANPQAAARVDAALGELPAGFSRDIKLELLDDGLPSNVKLQFSATDGISVSGKAPKGMDIASISAALAMSGIKGNLKDSTDDGAIPMAAHLEGIGKWLTLFESLDVDVSAEGLSIKGQITKGADIELVNQALLEQLGEGAVISLSEFSEQAADGSERINIATGRKEFHTKGFWLPKVKFEPTRDQCETQTLELLKISSINFITGSARLGARATGIINQLAATLLNCLSGELLTVEVGGHTDSRGDDNSNQALSLQRAAAVANAMVVRGVNGQFMSVKGYGEEQPVADNTAAEGRALNRRTSFIWTEK